MTSTNGIAPWDSPVIAPFPHLETTLFYCSFYLGCQNSNFQGWPDMLKSNTLQCKNVAV